VLFYFHKYLENDRNLFSNGTSVISSSFNKLDAIEPAANSSSPCLPKSAGFENSRGFEPEGEVINRARKSKRYLKFS